MVLISEVPDPDLCACRDLRTWVKAQPGAASSCLAPNPFGSWLPGDALRALLDTLIRQTDLAPLSADGQSLADVAQLPISCRLCSTQRAPLDSSVDVMLHP